MLYQIAIYGNTTAWESVTERDADELARAHAQVIAELTETGELVAHHELDLDEAVVLGPGDTTIPGVLQDGQWVAGGFYFLDCDDLDRAQAVAREFREIAFAPIEIRRVRNDSSWDKDRLHGRD